MSKKFPVAEVFGPTIQGEGVDQGVPCFFVRFGGCDFKCEWCDTPHAVLAENVRHLPRMDEEQIIDALKALPRGPEWVVLSGGNPALHELGALCSRLQRGGLRVAVETQATRYKQWLREVNRLCLSPKPPSSGMKFDEEYFFGFLRKVMEGRAYEDAWKGQVFLKIVVFDHTDYEWAKYLIQQVNEHTSGIGLPYYLSAGNDAGATVGNPSRRDDRTLEQVRSDLLSKSLWLTNRVMVDRDLAPQVTVQSQYHVLLWGNKLGV